MSDAQPTDRPLPYFNNAEAEVDPDVAAHPAFARFLTLTPADRSAHTRHIEAHYRDNARVIPEDFFEEILEEMGGPPETPDALWPHITPLWINLNAEEDGRDYILVSCSCPWDPEHGIVFSFEDGATLVMVGSQDDHSTNIDAYDDPTLGDVVYNAVQPDFTTRRTDP